MRPIEIHPLLFPSRMNEGALASLSIPEWRQVLVDADENGLLWHLGNAEAVPAEVREDLRQQSLVVVARNLALAGELRQCLRVLRRAGVDCAPLRGIALMERLYGEIVARPMGDIDFLVRRDQTHALREALGSLGYREVDRRPGFSEDFSYSLKFLVERSFTIVLDPHLSIAYPPAMARLDMEDVWRRCSPAVVAGEPTLSLGDEDLLLHLALHVAHRDHPPLIWLWELDALFRAVGEDLDWDLLVASAREIGVGRILGAVLARLESSFATPIPVKASNRLAPADKQGGRPLAQEMAELSSVPEREGLAQLLALEGWRRKSRYVTALLMPSSEFMMQQYGLQSRFHLPWAYVRRALGFCWSGATGIARLLLSHPGERE